MIDSGHITPGMCLDETENILYYVKDHDDKFQRMELEAFSLVDMQHLNSIKFDDCKMQNHQATLKIGNLLFIGDSGYIRFLDVEK